MEHALLHGLQLCGLIFTLGGVLFRILVLGPVLRTEQSASLKDALERLINRWISYFALLGAISTILDLFVQLAEIEGRTLYGPVDFSALSRYVSGTTVGALVAARAFGLLAIPFLGLLRSPAKWLGMLLAAGAAALGSTLVSHSAALPISRTPAITAQFLHIVGGAFWLGMLGYVLLVVSHLRSQGNSSGLAARIVSRFSPYALASALIIAVSGIYSACCFVVSPGAVWISAYGLTLLLKLALIGILLYPAIINWRIVRPALLTARKTADMRPLLSRFSRLLELELTAGIMAIVIAGILGAISPPAAPGDSQLNLAQRQALLSPSLPPARFVDPKTFVGAAARTQDDLRYSEFSHRWSGVFVIMLGLCWLAQARAGSGSRLVARLWPILLIPFGLFVAVVADPEVWLLRKFTWRETLANPDVLEHQIGAALVFVLAIFGLRDAKREGAHRPLGYALPIVIVAGSLMLLGHAHSNLSSDEQLDTLINVQHAIIGSLGLLAGISRWVQLRRLMADAPLRVFWPACIVLLGVFMAFFYRELVEAPMSNPSISEYVETT